MTNKLTQAWIFPPTWLRFLVIVVLVLGVFFRFINLDQKVYQHDEAFTSMRISGYSKPEVEQQLFDGQVRTVADVQKYQHPNPEKNLIDTVQVLAQYPEHPPLYYLMARFWAQSFGSSVAVIRSLSAVISLLAFPCIYWLCLELFESSLTGWVAIALIAVSPLHVLYAQEARQYSLWAVATLLASAALLRALRCNTKMSWGLYSITLVLGFYSNLLFGFVAIAHGVYVIATQKEREGKTIPAYLWASAGGFLAFSPWIIAIVSHFSRIQRFTKTWERDLINLGKWWSRNLNNIFFDFDPSLEPFDPLRFDDPFLAPLVLLLVGYALYFLYRHTPPKTWLLVFSVIAITALPLVGLDLIRGGGRSTAVRYLIPFYLGIQLAVAFLLASKMTVFSHSVGQQRQWRTIFGLVLCGGIVSCMVSLPAQAWWNKFVDYYNPQVAEIVNQTPHPLIISDTKIPGSILSLSHLLAPEVRLQLIRQDTLDIPPGFQNVFLFDTSDTLRGKLENEKGYKLKPAFKGYNFELWKLSQ